MVLNLFSSPLSSLLFLSYLLHNLVISTADATDAALSWNVKVSIDKRKKDAPILKHAFGRMKAGSLHAIIGSSGSGKTTLLNVLAGVETRGLRVSGEVQSSFETSTPVYVQQEDLLFPQLTVQETLETATKLRSSKSDPKAIAERLTADLGLKKVIASRVGDAKTRGISGGEKKRLAIGNEIAMTATSIPTSVSSSASFDNDDERDGQERRLIFLDEPTSGLDSFQALNVVQLLKQLAKQGNSVMISIHQPRASIIALFDEVTLLSEGNLIYTGAASTLSSFFRSQGYSVPANTNPIEYFIDLLSVDYSSSETERASRQRIQDLAGAFKTTQYADSYKNSIESSSGSIENDLTKRSGKKSARKKRRKSVLSSIEIGDEESFYEDDEYRYAQSSRLTKSRRGRPMGAIVRGIKKFRILFVRAWRQVTRDSKLNFARLMSSLFVSLLYGAIYNKLSLKASSIPDRLGLLQIAAVSTAMTTVVKATTTFVTERQIVNRERKSDAYGTLSYLLSKLAAELPLAVLFPCISGSIMYKMCGLNPDKGKFVNFLKVLTVESIAAASIGMAVGSFAPSTEAAVAIAPSVMVIFIVFGGLFVVNTPHWCSWMPKASLIKWGYEALCVNEFSGLTFQPTGPVGTSAITKGETLLENIGFENSSLSRCLDGLGAIILTCYTFTYLSLLRQKPSSEPLWKKNKHEDEDGLEGATSSDTTITAEAVSTKSKLNKDENNADVNSREMESNGVGNMSKNRNKPLIIPAKTMNVHKSRRL